MSRHPSVDSGSGNQFIQPVSHPSHFDQTRETAVPGFDLPPSSAVSFRPETKRLHRLKLKNSALLYSKNDELDCISRQSCYFSLQFPMEFLSISTAAIDDDKNTSEIFFG